MKHSFDAESDSNSKLIIAISIVLFAIFIIWAQSTRLDMVTRGQGRVVVTGQNQTVQVAQKGSIVDFHAAVGQKVTEGDVLAEVNPTEAAGLLAETEERLRTMELRRARLDAELEGRPFETEFDGSNLADALLMAEMELMDARRTNLEAQEKALIEARLQKERELEAVQAELRGTIQREVLLMAEAAQILPLVELGALGVSEKFRIERDQNSLETQKNVLREKGRSLEFAISETAAQITAAQARNRNDIFAERADVLGQLAELSQRLPALRQRVAQTEVRAPVSGTINQVFFNTIGAVVSEGEMLAEIVPSDGDLQIEALVLPEDIASVEPGQPARISLTAYDATKFGTIDGTVIRVSADASFREETQTRMFVVETSLNTALRDLDGNEVPILPGMVAQIDIIRGQRSILDYFWNPIAKVQDRASRE
ncbi:MAG: HlyD family type I secretion periplasmic adaptor subunit [Planktomarina sp.]